MHAKYGEAGKRRRRELHRKVRYGLAAGEYDTLYEAQKGLCAICHEPQPFRYRLFVDHDHKTGKARELLCVRCNSVLGHCQENIHRLLLVAAYILKHKGVSNAPEERQVQKDHLQKHQD